MFTFKFKEVWGRDCKLTLCTFRGFVPVASLIVDYLGVQPFLIYVCIYPKLYGICKGNLLIVECESLWTKCYWGWSIQLYQFNLLSMRSLARGTRHEFVKKVYLKTWVIDRVFESLIARVIVLAC